MGECLCGHGEDEHGGAEGWCNHDGCICSMFDLAEDEWAEAGMHVIKEVDG